MATTHSMRSSESVCRLESTRFQPSGRVPSVSHPVALLLALLLTLALAGSVGIIIGILLNGLIVDRYGREYACLT